MNFIIKYVKLQIHINSIYISIYSNPDTHTCSYRSLFTSKRVLIMKLKLNVSMCHVTQESFPEVVGKLKTIALCLLTLKTLSSHVEH